MRSIKKIIAYALCMCSIFALTACGNSNKIRVEELGGNKYYVVNEPQACEGEYNIQEIMDLDKAREHTNENWRYTKKDIMSYEDYVAYCDEWDLTPAYKDTTKKYLVFLYTTNGSSTEGVKLVNIDFEDNTVKLYIWDNYIHTASHVYGYFIEMPIDDSYTQVEYESVMSRNQFNRSKNGIVTIDKPVIYIYPEDETKVGVTFGNPERLTCSYPKYEDNWKVIAYPDGTLKYGDKSLYCLYYESESTKPFRVEKTGFIVPGEEVASFLEEKLNILGLNDREAEEFIIYWLPKLEQNKYNYIRFATNEEIEQTMSLEVTPTPDTTIRILMTYRSIDHPVKVQEQVFEPIERRGYTVVEWGGTEIK